MFYLVKWRDLPHTECSWEAEDDCPAADFKKFVTSYKLNREKMLDIHMQKMEKRGLATGEKQKKKKSSKSKHEERVTEKPIETDVSLVHCYPLIWNITNFNVFNQNYAFKKTEIKTF